jgi:hypothetical protein
LAVIGHDLARLWEERDAGAAAGEYDLTRPRRYVSAVARLDKPSQGIKRMSQRRPPRSPTADLTVNGKADRMLGQIKLLPVIEWLPKHHTAIAR